MSLRGSSRGLQNRFVDTRFTFKGLIGQLEGNVNLYSLIAACQSLVDSSYWRDKLRPRHSSSKIADGRLGGVCALRLVDDKTLMDPPLFRHLPLRAVPYYVLSLCQSGQGQNFLRIDVRSDYADETCLVEMMWVLLGGFSVGSEGPPLSAEGMPLQVGPDNIENAHGAQCEALNTCQQLVLRQLSPVLRQKILDASLGLDVPVSTIVAAAWMIVSQEYDAFLVDDRIDIGSWATGSWAQKRAPMGGDGAVDIGELAQGIWVVRARVCSDSESSLRRIIHTIRDEQSLALEATPTALGFTSVPAKQQHMFILQEKAGTSWSFGLSGDFEHDSEETLLVGIISVLELSASLDFTEEMI